MTASPADNYRLEPSQHYAQAMALGFDQVQGDLPSAEQAASLGITVDGQRLRVPALDRELIVDCDTRTITLTDGRPATEAWGILVLHYVQARNLQVDATPSSFAEFPDCQFYVSVFGGRIVNRFLYTIGRTAESFIEKGQALGATRLPGPDLSFRFAVFPTLPITITRFEGDDELPPGANVIYQADAVQVLPAEDRVVAAEQLLNVLAGKPMAETK